MAYKKLFYKFGWAALPVCLMTLSADASLVDPSFDPGTGAGGGLVETVLPLADGKILACGNFTSFNGSNHGYVVRLNSNGSVDESFNAAPGYWVRHMAVQPDGKIVIGGFFNSVQGKDRNRIARLNSDGSLDDSFQVGLGAQDKIAEVAGDPLEPNLFQVAVQADGKIVLIGNFATYNGVLRNGIARLNSDGSLDTSFDPGAGFNSWGRSIHLLDDGRMIATGWFTSYDNHPFNRMVVLSSTGQPDLSFNPYFGDSTSVYDMIYLSDGKMIVAGHSINTEGLFRREVARINPDGSFDDSFVGTTNEKTESARLQPDGKIVVGGYFSQADGAQRNGIARFNPDGTLDPDFSATFDNFIWTLNFDHDGKLLASGGFTTVDGLPRGGIVRLNTGIIPSTNIAPAVSITSPTNNATFTAPANLTVTANASDTDGQISQVLFYNGLNLIGQKNSAPYTISVTNLAAGSYELTARAIDNSGGVTLSLPIQITVNPDTNQPPSVSITSPTNNASFTAPASFNLAANAMAADGQIAQVSFYNGTNLIGQATAAPYTISVTNLGAGSYQIMARVTDDRGGATVSTPIQITINPGANVPPSIAILSPGDNSVLSAPRDLVISVNSSDVDGSITKVEFFNGRGFLGQSTTPPFTFVVTNAPAGTYTLLALATDNSGASALSIGAHVSLITNQPPNTSPTLTWSLPSNGTFPISIRTVTNYSYILQSVSNFQTMTWQTITNFPGTGADVQILAPMDQSAAFFRVRSE